jgi:WD40 repeat protein
LYGTYDEAEGGVARVVDLSQGHLIATLKGHSDPVYAVASDDETHLIATGGGDGKLMLWNADTYQCLSGMKVSKKVVTSICFLSKAHLVLTGGTGGELSVVNRETGSIVRQIQLDSAINGIDVSPDQRTVAVAVGKNIKLFACDSWQLIADLVAHEGKTVTCIQYNPQFSWIATGGYDFEVRLWKTAASQ